MYLSDALTASVVAVMCLIAVYNFGRLPPDFDRVGRMYVIPSNLLRCTGQRPVAHENSATSKLAPAVQFRATLTLTSPRTTSVVLNRRRELRVVWLTRQSPTTSDREWLGLASACCSRRRRARRSMTQLKPSLPAIRAELAVDRFSPCLPRQVNRSSNTTSR
jgi:hypothetical protein